MMKMAAILSFRLPLYGDPDPQTGSSSSIAGISLVSDCRRNKASVEKRDGAERVKTR